MNMKTSLIPTILRTSSFALVATATIALTFASGAYSQYTPVGDGIAASPKVRQMLNEKKASATIATEPAPAMACPKCANVRTSVLNRQAKGAETLAGATRIVTQHTCTGCEVNWVVVGEGKAKHSVAAHKCTAEVPNNHACCATN